MKKSFISKILILAGILTLTFPVKAKADEIANTMSFFASSKAYAEKVAENLDCKLVYYNNGIASINMYLPYDYNPMEESQTYAHAFQSEEESGLSFEYTGESIQEMGEALGVKLYQDYYLYADVIESEYGNICDEQWYMPFLGLPDAWEYTEGDGAKVAVIDSGVDASHPELSNNIVSATTVIPDSDYGTTYNTSYKGPQDNAGHGTHVCGIVAAANDNNSAAGVGPKISVTSIKALDLAKTGKISGKTSYVASAINQAVSQGVDVINLSLGGAAKNNDVLQAAVDNALNHGIAVVCAAGNSHTNAPNYPAACEGAIGVSGLKLSGDSLVFDASYSNYGSYVDVSAPGTNIFSTIPGSYGYKTGTSMATPMVSASLAMLRTIKSDISLSDMEGYLYNSATDMGDEGKDEKYGSGAINVFEMVKNCYEDNQQDKPDKPDKPDQPGNSSESGDEGGYSGDNTSNDDQSGNNEGTGSGGNGGYASEGPLLPGSDDDMMYALDVLDGADVSGKNNGSSKSNSSEKSKSESGAVSDEDAANGEIEAMNSEDEDRENGGKSDSENDDKYQDSDNVTDDIVVERHIEDETENKSLDSNEKEASNLTKSDIIAIGIFVILIIGLIIFLIFKRKKDEEEKELK